MSRRGAGILFFAFGFAATAGQVLLLRLGIVLGGGNELVLGAFFGAWFAGIAAGAASGRRLSWTPDRFRWLAAFSPALIFVNALIVMAAAGAAPPPYGHLPSLGRGMLLAAALALLPGMGIGLAFPAGAAAAGGITRLFLLESVGSAGGGILATVLLLRLDPFGALGGLAVLGALLLPGRARLGAPAAAAVLWIVWGPLDALWTATFHPVGCIAAEVNSPYQHILMTEWEGQTALYLNGQAAGQSPDPAAAERFRILSRLVEKEGEAALISAWPAIPPKARVVWIQPDAALVRLRRKVGGGPHAVVTADSRTYLARQEGRFSLLLFDLPPPVSVAQERLFSAESFREAARALSPEGLLAVPLPASENYWGKETARMAGSLYRTLREAFPDVAAAVGPLPCLLASPREGWLAERLEAMREGEEGAAFSALFPRERMEAFGRLLEGGKARVSSDARPFAYLNALAVREKMDRQVPLAGLLLGLSPWLLLFLSLTVVPYWPGRRRPLFQVFSTGILGIGVFLLLSIRYQSVHGTYYGAVGVLTGLFMLGLAASAPLARRLAPTAAPWLLDAAALAFLGLILAVPSGPGWLFGLWCALAGIMTGLPFVFQGVRLGDGPSAAARMQFHDHLGAALGAVATGLLFMPLLGLNGTVFALAGMKTLSLLLNLRPTPA